MIMVFGDWMILTVDGPNGGPCPTQGMVIAAMTTYTIPGTFGGVSLSEKVTRASNGVLREGQSRAAFTMGDGPAVGARGTETRRRDEVDWILSPHDAVTRVRPAPMVDSLCPLEWDLLELHYR